MLQEIAFVIFSILCGLGLFFLVLWAISRKDWSYWPGLPEVERIAHADRILPPGSRLKYRVSYEYGWRDLVRTITYTAGFICIAAAISFALWRWNIEPRAWGFPFAAVVVILLFFSAIFALLYICLLVWDLMVELVVKPTLIESSHATWREGETYDLLIIQEGPLKLKSLSIIFRCRMEFERGVGKHREYKTMIVHETPLLKKDSFEIEIDAPLELETGCKVPKKLEQIYRKKQKMNRNGFGHTDTRWEILVSGSLGFWPPLKRSFFIDIRDAEGYVLF